MERVSSNHSRVESREIRRSANYKPNIWNYDHLMKLSLSNERDVEGYKEEAEKLKEEVGHVLCEAKDPLYKLGVIDEIDKLALSYYFEEEIGKSMKEIEFGKTMASSNKKKVLRQLGGGYRVSLDSNVQLLEDDKTEVELLEASHLALEHEHLLDRANAFGPKNLVSCEDPDNMIAVPSHRSVTWFDAKKHISKQNTSALHRLARLSFNMVQVQHQKDLQEILRWWGSLSLSEALTFTRDRAVESFLWAVGVAYEPQHGSLRKWLTKAIILVLLIDDLYDIYGSIQELEQFTTAVEKWDPVETQFLPEVFRRCFWALYDTATDIDSEIQKLKGWESILPHLREGWTGFCKALFVEAKWYHEGRSPCLEEYLENGWRSSSGPLLSLHTLIGVGHHMSQTMAAFNTNREIIRYASLIFRLCNDHGTSKAELERGDAPSSILCYMREANVREKQAREEIRSLITDSWRKMNGLFIKCPNSQKPVVRYILNIARVANFVYQNGDGCGVQDRETRQQVLSCLIDPLNLP